jgi:hypothetical protein
VSFIAPTAGSALSQHYLQGIEYRFGLLLAIFGLAFVFVLPPLHAPDEPTHFIHAYSVAHGQLLGHSHDAEGWAATDIPANLLPPVRRQGQEERSRWQDIREMLSARFNGERRPSSLGHLSIYHFFPYIPQAVGIRVGRWLTQRPLLVMSRAEWAISPSALFA